MRPSETQPAPPTKITPRVLSFAGIDATNAFLNLHPGLTDTQDREIIAYIRTVARGTPWWVGDFGLHFRRKRELITEQEAAKAKEDKRAPMEQADWADVLSEAWDIAPTHIRNAATICAFFPISDRSEKLSFRHHVDAARAAGGTLGGSRDKAREWLKKAEAGGWSCADLRENALPPSQTTPPSTPEDNPFLVLDTADKWVTQHRDEVKLLTPERAANLLVRMQAVVELVDHLRVLTGANIARINERHQ